jgi:predicted phosphoribosyltransferase
LQEEADEAICAQTPEPFRAVGLSYRDFAPTTDEEVHDLLEQPVCDLAQNGISAGR